LTADWLDLPAGVGQLVYSWRLRLFDGVTDAERSEMFPKRDSPPTLSCDMSATIHRKLSSVTLDPVDSVWFRPLVDRLRLEVTVNGVTFQMGRYLCIDDIEVIRSGGSDHKLTFVDEMFMVDQSMETGFYAGGLPVSEAAKKLLAGLPIKEPQFDYGPHTSINSWSAGTSRASVWRDLAVEGGYLPPWFDYSGTPRMIQTFDPATRTPDFDWDTNHVVVMNSITRKSDLPDAPNRWIVISNDTSTESDAHTSAVFGYYDIPASAPHSKENRGFIIQKVIDTQITTSAQATLAARTLGITSPITETVSCETIIDPRGGVYDDAYHVIRFLGEQWLERYWSMPLDPTGTMGHTLTRAWPQMEDL
jgi:hypothetical protein